MEANVLSLMEITRRTVINGNCHYALYSQQAKCSQQSKYHETVPLSSDSGRLLKETAHSQEWAMLQGTKFHIKRCPIGCYLWKVVGCPKLVPSAFNFHSIEICMGKMKNSSNFCINRVCNDQQWCSIDLTESFLLVYRYLTAIVHSFWQVLTVWNHYHIVGNFRGRKLSQIGGKYDFCGENFCRLLALLGQKMPCPKFCGENFHECIATKLWNLQNFSPSKKPHEYITI